MGNLTRNLRRRIIIRGLVLGSLARGLRLRLYLVTLAIISIIKTEMAMETAGNHKLAVEVAVEAATPDSITIISIAVLDL